jgi:hypothetical protein
MELAWVYRLTCLSGILLATVGDLDGNVERPFLADSRRTQAAVAEMVEPQSHRRTFDAYSAYSLPNNDERMRSSGLIWNRVINTAKITGPSIAQTLRR